MFLRSRVGFGIPLALVLFLLLASCKGGPQRPTPTLVPTAVTTPGPATAIAMPTRVPTYTSTIVPTPVFSTPSAPGVEVSPTSVAPGEAITLRGSGWPPNGLVSAHMYETPDASGPGASISMAVQTDANGNFTIQGTVTRTLFGAGSRGNLNVVPGDYTIVVFHDPEVRAATRFTVGAPSRGALLWGEVSLDINGNGQRDLDDPRAWAEVSVEGAAPGSYLARAITDARGRYVLSPIEPGQYRLVARAQFQSNMWEAIAMTSTQDKGMSRVDLLLHPSS